MVPQTFDFLCGRANAPLSLFGILDAAPVATPPPTQPTEQPPPTPAFPGAVPAASNLIQRNPTEFWTNFQPDLPDIDDPPRVDSSTISGTKYGREQHLGIPTSGVSRHQLQSPVASEKTTSALLSSFNNKRINAHVLASGILCTLIVQVYLNYVLLHLSGWSANTTLVGDEGAL